MDALFLLSLLFIGQSDSSQEFELVQPESYAIRRFAEVVESQLESIEAKDKAELLIEMRAQLAVSSRQLEAVQRTGTLSNGSLPLSLENTERALRGLVQHYEKRLKALEASARRKR